MRVPKSTFRLLLAAAGLTLSTAAFATTPRGEAGDDILMEALNDNSLTLAQMLQQITVRFRTRLGICKSGDPESAAECLRGTEANHFQGELNYYITYAVGHGKLDPVEGASLAQAITAISSVKGNDVSGVTISDQTLKPAPTGKDLTLPPLLPYRMNKADFAALRKAKNMEEVLPANLVKQITKSFPRKMNGVGSVTPEQYFAAQFGRLQLNELAGLMVSAADFLTRPDATVYLYPANHSATVAQIKDLESREVALAESIAGESNLTKRVPLQTELSALQAKLSALEQSDPASGLLEDRAVKNERMMSDVVALADIAISDGTRSSVGTDLVATAAQLDQIDKTLASLIRTEVLPPEDVQRLAINSLHSDFQTLVQESPFNQLSLVPADALLAAWVSGDLSSQAFSVLTQFPGLKEIHQSVWAKALAIGWSIAQPALMIFPATSYIAIAVSVILEIRQAAIANRQEGSNETHIVPLQPNSAPN